MDTTVVTAELWTTLEDTADDKVEEVWLDETTCVEETAMELTLTGMEDAIALAELGGAALLSGDAAPSELYTLMLLTAQYVSVKAEGLF